MDGETAVDEVPRVVGQAGVVGIVSVAEARGSAGAGSAFPLGLGGQAVLAAGKDAARGKFARGEERAIIGGGGPAHIGNGSAQIAGEDAGVLAGHVLVFALGHFKFSDPKTVREGDGGLRPFVDVAMQFIGGAAHGERIGLDKRHVRGRGRLRGAVKVLRCESGNRLLEIKATERVVHGTHGLPCDQIAGTQNGVSTRRPGEGELKRADDRERPDEARLDWISMDDDAVILQGGDGVGEQPGGGRLGEHERLEGIAAEE